MPPVTQPPITPVAPPIAPPKTQDQIKPAKKIKWSWIISALVLLLIISGILLYLFVIAPSILTDSAEKVSNAFVVDIQEGANVSAYMLTTPDFQRKYSIFYLGSETSIISPLILPPASTTVVSVGVKSTQGYVTYGVNCKHGPGTITVTLDKLNNSWLVSGFSTHLPQ